MGMVGQVAQVMKVMEKLDEGMEGEGWGWVVRVKLQGTRRKIVSKRQTGCQNSLKTEDRKATKNIRVCLFSCKLVIWTESSVHQRNSQCRKS